MRYFLLSFIMACKLQPFSTPRDGALVVPNSTQQEVDYYLQIEEGVVVVKENDKRTVTLKLHDMKLRQPQNSYAVSRGDNMQLLDGIDNVIIDSYKGQPHLFYLDEIKFSITPKASEPYVYTCTFSNVVLGKVKFSTNAKGCTSNTQQVNNEKIIKEKCNEYAEVSAMNDRDQLNYKSKYFNAGKAFGEGDIYIYKRTHKVNTGSCVQYAVFDSVAIEFMKAHNLTCKDRFIKTPHMGDNIHIIAECLAVDIVFFSGQADGTLQVLSKYRNKITDANGTYFEGLVYSIKADGTHDFKENKAVSITAATTP